MTTKIKLIRSVEYLQTSPEGEINFDKSKMVLAEMAKAKRPPADFDILLDFRRAQWILSTADIYYLAAELGKHNHTYRDKVAVLVLPGNNFDKSEFFELCAQNRGFNVETFTNYEEAVQWFFENKNSN